MKFILAIFAIYLAATYAAVAPPVNYEIQVNNIIQEVEKISLDTAHALAEQYAEIALDPLQQIEEALKAIEDRKEENEPCVVAQEPAVILTVDTMNDEMNICGLIAAKTSAKIMNDVSKATHQLIFDGLDVARLYRKCKKYKNIVMKNSCYTRLTIKGTLYLNNARKSIKTIKESTNERIPAVFTDLNICTHTAASKAVAQLDYINTEIDDCIAGV